MSLLRHLSVMRGSPEVLEAVATVAPHTWASRSCARLPRQPRALPLQKVGGVSVEEARLRPKDQITSPGRGHPPSPKARATPGGHGDPWTPNRRHPLPVGGSGEKQEAPVLPHEGPLNKGRGGTPNRVL